MWYPILVTVLTGYLLGNLNGAVCMSALLAHDDVRGHGSGSAGLTNFARNYGGFGTALVMLVDVSKTVLACLLGGLLLAPYGYAKEGQLLGAMAVSLGHDFPVLLGFRGGKGIVCGISIAFVVDWRVALCVFAAFCIFYFASGYVSLGSVMGAVTFAVGFAVFWHDTPPVMIGGMLVAALALFMHRANIVRLCKGTETKTNIFAGRKRK